MNDGQSKYDKISPSLEELLEFEDIDVIESFSHKYGIDMETSKELFKDTLRFLWISSNVDKYALPSEVSAIDEPLIIIDEMWHNFILHTASYTKFCQKYFGMYIHHLPNSKRNAISRLTADEKEVYIERKRQKYEAIYDTMGRDVFYRWYVHYPLHFSIKEVYRRLHDNLQEVL